MKHSQKHFDFRDESGQSLIEFLLFIPILLAITGFTLRVNAAIQSSIVDQKYARAQTFTLTSNSAYYPRNEVRNSTKNTFGRISADQMVLGVSSNIATEGYNPKATTISIVSEGKPYGNDDPGTIEHRQRGRVRIRNTVTLCTQYNPNLVADNGSSYPDAAELSKEFKKQNFNYCRRLYKDE